MRATIFHTLQRSSHEYNEGAGSKNTSLISGLVHSLGVAEEWLVETVKNYKRNIIVSIIVIAVIILAIVLYPRPDGFTAKAAYDDSQDAILEQGQNPDNFRLISVQTTNLISGDVMVESGRFKNLQFIYVSSNFSETPQRGQMYVIQEKHLFSYVPFTHPYSLEIYNITKLSGTGEDYTIENWEINSDRAYKLALKNEQISSIMDYKPEVTLFVLNGTADFPIWHIYWNYNNQTAMIKINATTGDIIVVDLDYIEPATP